MSTRRRAFGNVGRVQERFYEARRVMWLDEFWRDISHDVRALGNRPGFAFGTILTLAIAIAANTAVFSVADTLLLRPLPYPDADRLVVLRMVHSGGETPGGGMASARDLADWQAQATSFEAIAGYRWRSVDLRGASSSERLRGLYATPEYFDVFGITRVNGRVFGPSDRGTNAIVLGRRVWENRFQADPALIGSMLDVSIINLGRSGATPNVVLGAALVDAHFPPLTSDFNLGVGNEDDTIVTEVRSMDQLVSESLASRSFATILLTICAVVALVLALSGIHGIVSQAAARRRMEIGIRIALGATARRVVALMLRRSMLPVAAGIVLGLLATMAATRLWAALLFGVQPLDPLTFAGTTATFAAVALAAGLVPACRAARLDPVVALKTE